MIINKNLILSISAALITIGCIQTGYSENLYEEVTDSNSNIVFSCIAGGTFTMGEPESCANPRGACYSGINYDAGERQVTLSDYCISQHEISNAEFVKFLNLVSRGSSPKIAVGDFDTLVEDGVIPYTIAHYEGKQVVYFTSKADSNSGFDTNEKLEGMVVYDLDGSRVLKDHHYASNDNDAFTGEVQPENPLNIAMIGYDPDASPGNRFYVKDPHDDIDWDEATNYQNWGPDHGESHVKYGDILNDNDPDIWSELQTRPNGDYTSKMPSLGTVKKWPANFTTWYGAKAFAKYYGHDLPSEAQWEYAAMVYHNADNYYIYATPDGNVEGNGDSANWNHEEDEPALRHVSTVDSHGPSPYGLYNMAGNTWEWVDDWYMPFDGSEHPSTDPIILSGDLDNTDCDDNAEPASGCYKIYRGGSWNYHEEAMKSKARFYDEPWKSIDHFSFRVIKANSD